MDDDLPLRTPRLADDWPMPSPPPPSHRRALAARLDDASVAVAARTGVTPRAVVGLLVVALVVAGVLGARLVVARARSAPAPLAPTASSAPLARAATIAAATGTPTSTVEPTSGLVSPTPGGGPTQVVVHVVGQVRHAGVVHLAIGARIEDALRAAGGATRRADLAAVNLARLAVDGEQVVVPRPGQQVAPLAAPAAPGNGSGSAGAVGPGHVIELNAATPEQLDELPGVGPVLAGRIVAWRAEHGRFSSVDELSEVSGIGDKVMERLRALVRV